MMPNLPMLKGFAAAVGVSVMPWQGQWYKHAISETVEMEATVSHAVAIGYTREAVLPAIKAVRAETGWEWSRIREHLTKNAFPPQEGNTNG